MKDSFDSAAKIEEKCLLFKAEFSRRAAIPAPPVCEVEKCTTRVPLLSLTLARYHLAADRLWELVVNTFGTCRIE